MGDWRFVLCRTTAEFDAQNVETFRSGVWREQLDYNPPALDA